MRGVLIVAGLVAIAYWVDDYWYHGVYFTALSNMASQVFAHF